MNKRVFSIPFLLVILTSSSLAFGGYKEQREAQKLSREANALAKKGEFKKAAKKYKKADNLMPAPSYKLGMAKMLVELGDLLQAANVLAECAATKARQYQEKRAVQDCQKMAEDVEERTPTLEIDVREPTAAEVVIRVSDEDFDPTDGAVDFNPGTYEVVAVADGYESYTEVVKLGEGDVETLKLRMVSKKGKDDEDEDGDDGGGFGTTPAFISWGVGGVGLGLGIAFGIVAINTTNEVLILYECQNGECPAEAEDDLNAAKINGNVSTAGFVVGLVGLAAGTALYFLADDDADSDDTEGDDEEEGRLRIEAKPMLGPGFVGLTGTF